MKTSQKDPVTRSELNFHRFERMRPNLFILRCSKGLSQKEISEAIGFKSTRWEQLECRVGLPSIQELMDISSFFGVPIDDILFKTYKIVFE